MYVDTSTIRRNAMSYTRQLLRESYREAGKVKHRTIANLSPCSPEEISAIKLALKHKSELTELVSLREALELRQGPCFGAGWLLYRIAKELKIPESLGHTRQGKLALWQVMARVIDQGSRLSAVRLASCHAACDILGLDAFHEDHLYANLDWLSENQPRIEERLFRTRYGDRSPGLYLYDVTSSYLEGMANALGAFGYCRDGKKGKKQIVIGLLCDHAGSPLSIEVFPGNTQDPRTFASQVHKVAERFGGGEVTFVGDRGMIKGMQIEDITSHGFHYITAITKPQIEALLEVGVFQMSLFDEDVAELMVDDGVRYVLRRNPVRAEEIWRSRRDKLASLKKAVDRYTLYLKEHPRAKLEVAQRRLGEKAERLRIAQWVSIQADGRTRSVTLDKAAFAQLSKLDGCYVLKTDLPPHVASKQTIHDRYKDLTVVERAFRTCKTVQLEMRPINVRLEGRTRGHAFVVMLAYRIIQELATRWRHLNITVEEGIHQLASLCTVEVVVNGKPQCHKIPQPTETLQTLLEAAGVRLPDAFPNRGVKVTTKKKLQKRRLSD
jgi:transposase